MHIRSSTVCHLAWDSWQKPPPSPSCRYLVETKAVEVTHHDCINTEWIKGKHIVLQPNQCHKFIMQKKLIYICKKKIIQQKDVPVFPCARIRMNNHVNKRQLLIPPLKWLSERIPKLGMYIKQVDMGQITSEKLMKLAPWALALHQSKKGIVDCVWFI